MAKRLFGIRIQPETGPHVILALLAESTAEAEDMARNRTGHMTASAVVRECGEGDVVLITFR